MDVTGYEISAANSFILFLFAGIVSIRFQRQNPRKPFEFLISNFKTFIILAVIPLTVSLLSNIFLSDCPVSEYAFFYLNGTIPALFLGILCGLISFELSGKYAYLFFIIIFFLMILSGIYEIYFLPQFYLYEPITGYIPGNIYDEDIRLTLKMISYRLSNIAFWASLLIVIQKIPLNKSKVRKSVFIVAVLAALIIFTLIKPLLGLSTSIKTISDELGGAIETEHCELFYPSESDSLFISYFARQSEFYYSELSVKLQTDLPRKIKIFAFKDRDQKKEYFGAANADVAKTWSGQIYIETGSINYSLKHEMAHILASGFGQWPFYMAGDLNFGLTEGLAVALDNNYNGTDPDYLAYSGYRSGYEPDFGKIFNNLSFFSASSSVSYVYAGSFIKYLMNKYGPEKIKVLYKTGSFRKVYGSDWTEFIPEYKKYLDSREFVPDKKEAEAYFSGKSLFRKYCPRLVAKKLKEAGLFYREKEFDKSSEIYRMIYNRTSDYRALRGLIFNFMNTGKYTEGIDTIINAQEKFKNSVYYDALEIYKGDFFTLKGELIRADSVYTRLLPDIYESLRDNILKKTGLIKMGIDSAKKYLLGNAEDRLHLLRKLNSDSLYYYTVDEMIMRNKQTGGNYPDFIKLFDTSKFTGTEWMQPVFDLSVYAKENGDYNRAMKFAQAALKISDKQHLQIFEENVTNIEWLIENTGYKIN